MRVYCPKCQKVLCLVIEFEFDRICPDCNVEVVEFSTNPSTFLESGGVFFLYALKRRAESVPQGIYDVTESVPMKC